MGDLTARKCEQQTAAEGCCLSGPPSSPAERAKHACQHIWKSLGIDLGSENTWNAEQGEDLGHPHTRDRLTHWG